MKHYERKAKRFRFNVEEYNSAMEVVDVIKKREITEWWRSEAITEATVANRKGFYGVKTLGEAYDLLKNGWTQEVERMNAALKQVQTVDLPKRVAFRNDVVGFAPVVPLAIMNVPNSMINNATKQIKSKVVKIFYSMGDSWCTSTETFLERGKKIMEAVIMLERSGYRCELYSAQFYTDRSNNMADVLVVKVKEANQPLDIKRVMFPFTHPAMFRVIGFSWEDRCPSAKYMSGRGSPFHTVGKHKEMFKEAFGDEYVYIDCKIADKGVEEIKEAITGGKK